jgi:hypothetical protein
MELLGCEIGLVEDEIRARARFPVCHSNPASFRCVSSESAE